MVGLQDLSAVPVIKHASTATYSCILSNSRELMFGIGDYDIHQRITPEVVCLKVIFACLSVLLCFISFRLVSDTQLDVFSYFGTNCLGSAD